MKHDICFCGLLLMWNGQWSCHVCMGCGLKPWECNPKSCRKRTFKGDDAVKRVETHG